MDGLAAGLVKENEIPALAAPRLHTITSCRCCTGYGALPADGWFQPFVIHSETISYR